MTVSGVMDTPAMMPSIVFDAPFALHPGMRGVPPAARGLTSDGLRVLRWHPADGQMSLPLLTLDGHTFLANADTMLGIAQAFGAQMAPHAKTPMSPVLSKTLLRAGAWGASVADLRQAAVMLEAGITRFVIANQIGGRHAVLRLAQLLRHWPQAKIYLFVDSTALLDALAAEWQAAPDLPRIHLLLEIGCGRAGVLTHAAFAALLEHAVAIPCPRIVIAGVACYEGTANRPDAAGARVAMDELFDRVEQAYILLRDRVGTSVPCIISAGGSSFFDLVLHRLARLAVQPYTTLLLRSGACYFSDHGPIRSRLQAVAARGLLGAAWSARVAQSFAPALRLWAQVLSVHGMDDCVICGFGLRDVSHDQGLPLPLGLWRNGQRIQSLEHASTVKLNDQHAFVTSAHTLFEVGDVIEFGIQHPCTCLDKHQVVYVLDRAGNVVNALQTHFG